MAQTFFYVTDSTGQIWQIGVQPDGSLVQTAVSSIPGVPTAPVVNAFPSLTGQQIVNLVQYNLGGLSNAVSGDQMLAFINEGKDELWSAMKQASEKFFVINSQTVDSTKTTYFPLLSTSVREYTLPTDLRDILFIEVLGPLGYETTRFTRRSLSHPEFRDVRMGATAFQDQGGTIPFTGISEYFYDVVGQGTMIIAQYPEVAFQLQIWYVRALPEITLSSQISEIVFPFSKKIADYAVMKIQLLKEDPGTFAEWKQQWHDDLVETIQGSERYSADPQYVADFGM